LKLGLLDVIGDVLSRQYKWLTLSAVLIVYNKFGSVDTSQEPKGFSAIADDERVRVAPVDEDDDIVEAGVVVLLRV
jgi:hypothetical protein